MYKVTRGRTSYIMRWSTVRFLPAVARIATTGIPEALCPTRSITIRAERWNARTPWGHKTTCSVPWSSEYTKRAWFGVFWRCQSYNSGKVREPFIGGILNVGLLRAWVGGGGGIGTIWYFMADILMIQVSCWTDAVDEVRGCKRRGHSYLQKTCLELHQRR